MHQAFSEEPQCISVCRTNGVLLLASVQPDNQSMTNVDTQSSIIEFMAGPSTTSSEMSDAAQHLCQTPIAIFQSVALLQETQKGYDATPGCTCSQPAGDSPAVKPNGRSQRGSPIELDVARTLEELPVLEAKLKEHLDLKKEMGAIMRSQAGFEDMAVEDLTTNLLKHAPAHSKLQVQSVPEVAVQLFLFYIYMPVMLVSTFYPIKDLIHTIGESAALGAAGFVIWGDLNLTSSRHNCTVVKSFLNHQLGQYITNVTRAAEVCSDFLCQSNGRCVRRDLHAPHYLHLNRDRYQIQPSGNGDFVVTGWHSQQELQLLGKRFHCHCYEGHAGEKCDRLTKVVEKENNEAGEAKEGEEQSVSAASETRNNFGLMMLLVLLNL
ncbi:hypothetical protein UPYG_G00262240 [Umbra pygmaea]|uniref:Hyaluronidase n=1 Tax=Umbra pygmaea TaxID=75934 RepID=A0ABD0W984_UMBPY